MPLFMTLLVRDEEDILDANHIIVTDNLSVDGSPDIIQTYVNQGVATYIRETDNTYSQSKWVSRMADIAHDAGASWVMHCDADEFWVAPKTDLKGWFSGQRWHNVVSAHRHDFVCLENDDSPFWQRMIYRKSLSTNPLGQPLPPKVAHRAKSGLTVAQGNHAVSGFLWPRILMSDLEILHFPLRSREQYIRKIENGGQAYANNTELALSVGNTWRMQYTELMETGTLAFVDTNTVSAEMLQDQLADGTIQVDTRLADFLDNRG